MFLLFINDLPENIRNKVFLFADDLKMIANALRKDIVDEDLKSLKNGRTPGHSDSIVKSVKLSILTVIKILVMNMQYMEIS